ncbi:MAG: hypothetical protein BIP78_1588 [Candidatus Bipolaricaulis sibiricus]|uniref:TPM domain-containing protein n=1 Tax=Bipolaricaulis sibiricus TaxID=2501609 RepID=A0A410FWJ3_BIPS1|nr:MAG: hypothetical protein BIP78_1588 [Candidatus Bipolaricaulis sibiricus]
MYLASWHDPFSNPTVYASAVFSAWRLPADAVLVVFLRGEDRRWSVEARLGEKAAGRVAPPEWEGILAEARIEANRAHPALAIANLATRLLDLLISGPKERTERPRSWTWAYVVLSVAGGGVLFLAARTFLCPHCLRPLRRRASFRGILWTCPRCRFTRTGLR